jgi:nucleoside-diphosphate-sugar epimerase
MRILVTGGTGFLGSRLVAKLSKKHKVTVFDVSAPQKKQKGVKYIEGDLLNSEDLDKAFSPKPEVVYHLAAILDETNPQLFHVNIHGTGKLLARSGKAKRFIFASPVGVLGSTKRPSREDDPYHPRTAYERSKVEAEKLVKNSAIPYTIIRMTIVYGPNRYWEQIFRAAVRGFPIIGSGRNYWHLLYVDDAVDALMLAMKPAAENRVYNIAGPAPHTYRETYEVINHCIGLEPPQKHIPKSIAKLYAFFHELSAKTRGQRPDVTKIRASIDRLTGNRIVDISRAGRELGFAPKFRLERGMRESVKIISKQKHKHR